MFDDKTRSEIAAEAQALGLEPAVLLAVVEVESGGRAFANVAGRAEPLIRFEGHYFDRLLPADKRGQARRAGLASPKAGAIPNPATQAARWALLERAMQVDREAALQSVSYGVGQVMGAHWRWLGYASVEALVAEARSGLAGQVRLMTRFIRRSGLVETLKARDWAGFARRYNGPAYAKHGYHTRLAAAWKRHRAGKGDAAPVRHKDGPEPASGRMLRLGARGEAVRQLQRDLAALGFFLAADGDFGPATQKAVRDFQRAHGLAADGIAGPETLATMARLAPPAANRLGPVERLLVALSALLRVFFGKDSMDRTGKAR